LFVIRFGEGNAGRRGDHACEIWLTGIVPVFDHLVEICVEGVGEGAEAHIVLATGGKISAVWY
jgi:hypothetical protein